MWKVSPQLRSSFKIPPKIGVDPSLNVRSISVVSTISKDGRSKCNATGQLTSLLTCNFLPLSQRSFSSLPPHRSSVPAPILFGQPTHETHPHILKEGEVTPGIQAIEYHERRARLLANFPEGTLVILPSADIKYRSGAVFHAFRQESNFYYLTGFNEPDSVCLLEKTGPGLADFVFTLIVNPKHAEAENWSGPRSGVEAAQDIFNADEAYPTNPSLPTILSKAIKRSKTIYGDIPRRNAPSEAFGHVYNTIHKYTSTHIVRPLAPIIHRQRSIKSDGELANMRRAASLSSRVLNRAMDRPWSTERDLSLFLDYEFMLAGCDAPAYIPVVSGGPRNRMVHYVLNNHALEKDDLILVDAGGEYGTYVTDISRAWPNNGKFSPAAKDLYEVVLDAQKKSIGLCRENAQNSLDQVHHYCASLMAKGLQSLGFPMDWRHPTTRQSAIDVLFRHHIGHHIGLDVHDCPGISRVQPLVAGNCITIEPGLYIPDDGPWPDAFRGLGIRIEDSIAVGATAPEVLSHEAVKEVEDIESLRS